MTRGLPESKRLAPGTPGHAEYMQDLLADWTARGWLRALDQAFAAFLWREVPEAPPLLILAAALTSHQLGRGYASLDLAATLNDPAFALSLPPEGAYSPETENPAQLPGEVLSGLSLAQWQSALGHPALVSSGAGDTPLVLVGSRLYLRRYWHYEQDVRAAIERRLQSSATWQTNLPIPELRRTLDALFPPASIPGQTTDWQKLACALAARSAFSIVTGGPGTGKTTTVVRLLALLQTLAFASTAQSRRPQPLRIRLAAPTGKAAARLNNSIAGAVANLPLAGLSHGDEIRASIPVKVTTLHRLLGSRPDTRHFRHHAGNPLALDVLVIDEASMVDLEMMASVLAALPASARLILLGDKDQLASVEAGAVLGELCRRARDGHFTPDTCDWLQAATGERIDKNLVDESGTALDQAVVMLRHSHRFSAGSGIGQLAETVNGGDTAALNTVLEAGYADLALVPLSAGNEAAFESLIIDGGIAATQTGRRPQSPESATARCGYRHYLEMIRQGQPGRNAGQAAFAAWARTVTASPWAVPGAEPPA